MFDLLKNFIIGGMEDQVGVYITSFAKSSCTKLLNAPFGFCFEDPWRSNEPFFAFFYRGGAGIFDSVLFTNLFSLATILLTFYISFLLFRRLSLIKPLSLVLSFIFSISPYALLHIGIHPQLSQIWLVSLFLYGLFSEGKFPSKCIFLGIILTLAVLISNYLGFFLFLFFICFSFSSILFSHDKIFIKHIFKQTLFVSLFVLIVSSPFLLPYVKANYFAVPSDLGNNSLYTLNPQRTLEDFQNFSARPWYFVLPPLSNPMLGRWVTKPVLDWMKISWGYFLADDYFPKEHGGDFLGWLNLSLFIIALYYAVRQQFGQNKKNLSKYAKSKLNYYSEKNLKRVLSLILTSFLLFLFTFPPFFTLGGFKIYTLGYLIFKFLPMFRVTARLGTVMLLLILIVAGIFLQSLYEKKKFSHLGFTLFLALYLLVSTVEFYTPVSIFDAFNTPSVYSYLAGINKQISFNFKGSNGASGYYKGPLIIAEFPSGRSEDIFWITRHNKGLLNPRTVFNEEYNFSSDAFTKALSTEEGLSRARELGVSYLVFHKNREARPEEEAFFRRSLRIEKEFPDAVLFNL